MSVITVKQKFNAPLAQVFNLLSQHATYNKVFAPLQIVHVKDSIDPSRPDGLGSVRQVGLGRYKPLTEKITAFEENKKIEYQIINNCFVRHHLGRILFEETSPTQTQVTYTIEFKSKIPFTSKLLLAQLKTAITLGFSKLAKSFD